MAFSPSASVAVALWIGRTVLMNASWPVQQAYLMGVVDPRERGAASSLTFAAWSMAGALTPPLGGALLAAHHYTAPFVIGALCYVTAIGLFFWKFHGVHPAAEHEEPAIASEWAAGGQ
jgi:MFS family permease